MPIFNPNIPQSTDYPSQSQNQLLQNFQQMNTAFEVDMVGYNAADQGKHAQVTFPTGPLTGQPFTYLSGEIGLQSLNQTPTFKPDIWLTRGSAGSTYPITGYDVDGTASSGWTYYPSGCLYAWGYATIITGTNVTISYISAGTSGGAGVLFPGFNVKGNPQATLTSSSATPLYITAITNTTFVVNGTNGSTFIWHAIGI